jgi:hypothetical protein
MTITNEQREALEAVAAKAVEVAALIHQDWGSAAPDGGLQTRVNRDMPKHGPDHARLKVEHALGAVVNAINGYLRPPPGG